MSNTGSAVATITSGANTPNPTIVFDSSGNFYIVATVSPSLNYTGTTLTSLQITVYTDTPNIEFSSLVTSQSPYTYKFGKPYEFNGDAAATVTNNTGQLTGQTLIYQIVTADSTTASLTPSTVATIDPTGWFLNTVSCGTTGTSSFRICATADALGDYGQNVALSDILTIERANPIINQYPQIILPTEVIPFTLVFGQPYTITPDPSQISTSIITSNTDEPVITYSTSDSTIATISGITVTLVKVGHFNITTTVNQTTNYNQILRSPSTQIYDIIQAVPTIQNFPTTALSAQTWVYGQPYPGIIPPPTSILTSNNDKNPPHISYSTSDSTVATISGNTINITGVGQSGVGNFQIWVNISETTNFSAVTYTYPSGLVYTNPPPSGVTYTQYQAGPATPDISFTNFITTATFGSTYNFVPPSLTNSDSTQSLTYSVYPAGSTVATMMGSASSPSFVLNSVGTFQIQAFCGAPTNNNQYNYFALPLNPLSPILSPTITVSLEMPIIEFIPFNTTYFFSQYTCQPSSPYSLSGPIASITNNTVQILKYSIVATDGVTPSTIATISPDGTSLTTKIVGFFQILATPTDPNALTTSDYGGNSQPSETIQIVSATPTIITFPTITPTISSLSPLPPQFIYGNTYQIPYTTSPPYPIVTTNTDTALSGPSITYSSTNPAIATISGSVTCSPNTAISSITGTTITINSVGPFQILVTIGATTNYNPVMYTYPSGLVYTAGVTYTSYNAIQATPTISPFPSNFGSEWVFGGLSDIITNSLNVTTNASSGYTDTNQVTYSIINQSVSNNATINPITPIPPPSSGFSQQITINDVGSFQIQADLAATTYFTAAASVKSKPITISPSTVALTFNFANAGYVYGGGPYTLPSNPTNNTDNPPPIITYTIQPGNSEQGVINNNTTLTITTAGSFIMLITVSPTENFNSANFSTYVNIAQAVPNLVMNSAWINTQIHTLTIGDVFGVYALFTTNSNTDPGVTYSLTPTIVNGIGTVSIENSETVYCNAPGIFSLQVTSNATTNFQASSFQTPNFYVSVVPEVIIFNNPGMWPPNNGAEVGLVICITPDSYPFGFNNYSALTISNYGSQGSFTLNATTSPTYNSVINNYMIFYNPMTSGGWLGNSGLSPSTASNIALVTINDIASGIAGPNQLEFLSNGQYLIFTFSGDTSGSAPDPLTIGWNPGGIDIKSGQVFGAYYPYANNITPPQNLPNGTGVTVSTLNSGSISGYFIAPWAGYGIYNSYSASYNTSITNGILNPNTLLTTSQVTLTLQQAWGIWTNINYGDQFGSTLTLDNVNYYYVGIPQLTNPVTTY